LYGATGGIRTHDLLITNQLLYQLSYGGEAPWTHHLPQIQEGISFFSGLSIWSKAHSVKELEL
jgi:hypothetical protein